MSYRVILAGALSVAALVAAVASAGGEPAKNPPATSETPAVTSGVLARSMNSIDGTPVNLAEQYKGKVVLIVNVASKCGYTKQYEGLQKLYESRKDQGLVVLGFPANNFGSQEPGSNTEIKQFCTSTYGVSFPMFEKISVKGEDQHPLYKALSSQPAPIGGEPKWNFTKFLLDRSGNVVARYEPKVAPDNDDLLKKIDELLKSSS